jgi:hypothetical protein
MASLLWAGFHWSVALEKPFYSKPSGKKRYRKTHFTFTIQYNIHSVVSIFASPDSRNSGVEQRVANQVSPLANCAISYAPQRHAVIFNCFLMSPHLPIPSFLIIGI